MRIRYYGHSCFTAESGGFTIGFDPYDPGVPGYGPLHIDVDALYCSHEHGDHHYLPAVGFRTRSGVKPNPFRITGFEIPHDAEGGIRRGMNTVRICEAEGKKIAHLGDIGCMPDAEQLAMLGNCDVVMIPVGGFFTIDYDTACAIVEKIRPKCAVPMHYRYGNIGFPVIADISDIRLGDVFRKLDFGEELEI